MNIVVYKLPAAIYDHKYITVITELMKNKKYRKTVDQKTNGKNYSKKSERLSPKC